MSEGARAKIVVVEDDPSIRELVCRVLESAGYALASTGEPTEAHALVLRESPDVVLCDIAMPGMDGYAVLKQLQSDPETARCPVVFLTAHREFSERVQAFRFGVVDYMTKPFTRELLLKRVEKVLAGLHHRPAHVAGATGPEEVERLVAEVKRDARTGVLQLHGEAGEASLGVRAGEVQGVAPDTESHIRAEFLETDPVHEDVATHDPIRLPGDGGGVVLADLPPMLRTALVVDDSETFRRFLASLLGSQGFMVYEAGDGDEGLRVALERRPWLILTDVSMPRVDGFELCRRVRSHSLIRHTPLIFLSGWDEYKDRYHGLQAGADEYLSKQTSVRELLIRIQLILKRYAELGARRAAGSGFGGEIEVVGAPGFLQMCHLGRLSGVGVVRWEGRLAEIRLRDGRLLSVKAGSLVGPEALFEILAWPRGSFEFTASDPGDGAPLEETIEELLLEGCRRLDEQRRIIPPDERPAEA
jgi:DNA-binding response OmpR family regulator